MAKLANTFEIGCDPEFVVLNKDGLIVNTTGIIPQKGPIGWDHSGMVVELRPEQARGSFTLLRRMQQLLNDVKMKKLANMKWRAGAYIQDETGHHYSLGGHIHFNINKSKFTSDMTLALDATVKLLEHLDILPTQECKKRRSGQYGKFGEIRSDWPDGHVEYRTISSYLHDPKVTFMALTVAKLAVCSPEDAQNLEGKTSLVALTNFVEKFRGRDINADRLLHNLERPKWLKTPPDTDMKTSWKSNWEGGE